MKLHVLDSGSGSVVRSMISKEDAAEEWKNKGLTFYAMKAGPNKTSMTKSGTFNSDVFESVSDDDVSVSSFTGTDVIKQDLAEDLKRWGLFLCCFISRQTRLQRILILP